MINKIFLHFLVSLTIIPVGAEEKFHYDCFGDPRDKKSMEFIKDIYNSAKIVGTFEVTEIGPLSKDSLNPNEISIVIKFRTIEILKGAKTKTHSHHIHIIGDTSGDSIIKIGGRYLVAFKYLNTEGSTKDELCDRAFWVPLKDANYYLEKFKKLKKSTK